MTATQDFVDHRELLFSIAYDMLGSVADTEDVLQETWLAWTAREREVDNPRAYLVRIAVNQALARRAEIGRRRETYVGQWLPEPLVTPVTSDPAERRDTASMALLVVLETLSPLERAVFVLHEVFAYPLTEIADMVGRAPDAVRQVAHRARSHVHARRPRYRPDPRTRQAVTERFLEAALGGDVEELLRVLAPDVTLWTDGGGKGPATSPGPIHGRDAVARVLASVAAGIAGFDVGYRIVGGDPAIVVFDGEAPVAVLVLTFDGPAVNGVYSITNPDKMSGVRLSNKPDH
ncbi:RNA polymerase sigma24 factor [Actinoplanes lobatus]|uniref:RNA polymerase sigma-70 factor (ECF subfamily) n=1 Tax=Actinoplanes lobatus TaxID=113568 RepID=A0A7W7MKQ0_9ACTN|nr:RNA polymerase sigma factor SigJ [Actinoplanes lobatus]MBB4753285.1 RNA polymerase sigma-70 factor (ECF subfamily) [Actinoplanes lobatus]GGN59480.1 RNA polymerase sigma24 factor [Actinoplanes lobatus]GIE37818.1 RNA polymerase sigma24 factor [Actinoplanes lobatus]